MSLYYISLYAVRLKDVSMKWDQGLLTVFLVVGLTVIGVAACGPSRSEVPLLKRPRAVKALDTCAQSIGKRAWKTVGATSGAASGSGTSGVSTTPICKEVLDPVTGKKKYQWSTEEFGYRLGANDRNQMSVQVTVQILVTGAAADATQKTVDAIEKTCGNEIRGLWKKERLSSTLDVKFSSLLESGRREAGSTSPNAHLLVLNGDTQKGDGVYIEHWSDRARFYPNGTRREDIVTCDTKFAQDPIGRGECYKNLFAVAEEANMNFCADVAIMVGHYLGLAPEVSGPCAPTPIVAPSPSPAPTPSPAPSTMPSTMLASTTTKSASDASFMKAATAPENRGESFWKTVRFTDADRKTITDRGCAAANAR